MKTLVFVLVFAAAAAQAQLAPEAEIRYAKSLESLSGPDLGFEITRRLYETSRVCGGEFAHSLYKQFNDGFLPHIEQQSPRCLSAADHMRLSLSESMRRAAIKAGFREKQKAYYSMKLSYPSSLPASLETDRTGTGFCLSTAESLANQWRQKMTWSPMSPGKQTTNEGECQIEQEEPYDVSKLLCTHDWVVGTYSLKHKFGVLTTRSLRILPPGEDEKLIKRQQEIIRKNIPVEEKQRLLQSVLTEDLQAGYEFLTILNFNNEAQQATLSFVGINRKTWMDGIYKERKSAAHLPQDCSMSVSFPMPSSAPRPGKIF
jgi:hypothetical protein